MLNSKISILIKDYDKTVVVYEIDDSADDKNKRKFSTSSSKEIAIHYLEIAKKEIENALSQLR